MRKVELGELISGYLEEKKMSAREFGRRCGFSNAYVSVLIKGIHPRTGARLEHTMETYQKVADGMQMPLEDLLRKIGYINSLTVFGNEPYNPFYDSDNEAYGTDIEWRKRHGAIDERERLQVIVDMLITCSDETLDKVIAVIRVLV